MHIIEWFEIRYTPRGETMRYVLLPALILSLSAPSSGHASTYQWRDDAGVIHYTDHTDNIPDKYLNRAKEVPDPAPAAKPTPPAAAGASPTLPSRTKEPAAAEDPQRMRLARELDALREGLPAKKKELARLHHKWQVTKGRTPSKEEIKEFEKKRAEGKATFDDNPYVNKNPLSPTAPARAAYYKKLQEVQKDEARVREIEKALE